MNKKIIKFNLLIFAMIFCGMFLLFTGCNVLDPNTEPSQAEIYVQPENSVKRYGATGDAKADDTQAFIKAMSEADSIYVPVGRYLIQSDITFDVPVTLDAGAILNVSDGATLIFSQYLDAGVCRIFEGNGNVQVNGNATVYPEWFGAKNDGATDSTSAIQKAIDSLSKSGGRVEFMTGSYLVSDTLLVTKNHTTLSGVSRQTRELSPMIVSTDSKKPVIYLKGTTSGNAYDGGLEDVTLEYLEITRQNMGIEGSDTILIENTLYTTIQHCGFAHSQNGIRAVNVNGLRLLTVHATTGGDIIGKEVCGVFIDGAERGSTGILISDYIYYAYNSSKSVTYGYKDQVSENAIGGSTGDRRITNFECDGSCDYGIYISSSGDFSCDISISDFTMDGIDVCGIYLKANNPYNWQQVNITNAYFRLANSNGKACAINAESFAFVHATNCHVDNAEGRNNGMIFKNTYGSTVTACSFSGGDYVRIVSMNNSKQCVISTNTSNCGGQMCLISCSDCILTSNSMPSASVVNNYNENCVIKDNIIK